MAGSTREFATDEAPVSRLADGNPVPETVVGYPSASESFPRAPTLAEARGGWPARVARAIRGFVLDYPVGALGGAVAVAFIIVGLLAPQLMLYDPDLVNIGDALQTPSATHLLGTDNLGRDLLSRIIFGARMSLYISMTGVGVGAIIGVVLGILAAYYRRLDTLIMRLMDILLAFPGIIVALTIIAVLGTGIANLIIAITIYQIPQYARLAHGLTLSVKEKTFVEAAIASGESDYAILAHYILPNIMAPLIVQTSLLIPGAIMTTASLSFLGLGVPAPTAEWGAMLQNSLQWARRAPHVMVIPGIALTLVVLAFNLLGDGLRDALDPRLQRR
jgi:ABC-type dipeptide/oligopeptide/nickel transport system permease subunit